MAKNQELILPGKEREHIYEELDNNLSMEEKRTMYREKMHWKL